MHLAELKTETPAELLNFAESLQIENVSSLRKQDIMFSILKSLAESDQVILGEGTLEILSDGSNRMADTNSAVALERSPI